MVTRSVLRMSIVLLGLSALWLGAGETAAPKSTQIGEAYPGLASSSLTYAKLSELPAGVILRTEGLTIGSKEIADEIAQAPEEMRSQLGKNGFFLLENLATRRILARQAQAKLPEQQAPTVLSEQDLLQRYFRELVASRKVDVTEAEVAMFYAENKDACGGATLEQIRDQVKQIVLQQKQQKLIAEHVRTLGQRVPIEISAAWTKEQAALAKDNPVDKARASGKPSLVDFGSTGCRPCDMLAPILETLKEKYAGRVNVLFVHVGQERVLAARYGIESIPMQFFYDEDGKEVFRHLGFWPQAEIEKKLAEMGVK